MKRLIIAVCLLSMLGIFGLACSNCEEEAEKQIVEAEALLEKEHPYEAYSLLKETIAKCPQHSKTYEVFMKSFEEWEDMSWGRSKKYDSEDWEAERKNFVEILSNGIEYLRESPAIYLTAIELIYEIDEDFFYDEDKHIAPDIIDFSKKEVSYYMGKTNTAMISAIFKNLLEYIDVDEDEGRLMEFASWIEKESKGNPELALVMDGLTEAVEVQIMKSKISEAKMVVKQIWTSAQAYYEENGKYPSPSTDIFGSGQVPSGMIIDRPSGEQRFIFSVLPNGCVVARPNVGVDPSLSEVDPIRISEDGIVSGGTIR